MGSDTVTPPPGFTLDSPAPSAGGPKPPPGFTLDAPDVAETPSPLVHGLKEFGAQVNPIEGIKGMAQATAHPIDTIMSDGGARQRIWNDSKAAFGKGDYATGAAKAIYSMIPFLGPNMARSGDQLASGDIAGGIGSTLGQATNLAAPTLLKGVGGIKLPGAVTEGAESVAGRLYKGALKPSAAIPADRAAGMVKTGLREAIPVTPDGIERLSGLIDDVNGAIKDQIDAAGPGRTITGNKAIANVENLKSKFADQVNPSADLGAIDASQHEFQGQLASDLTAREAQAMKTGTYQQLKSRSYGELKSATVEAQKALARGLKDELNEQFPELQALNARDSALLQLDPVLERAVQRTSNRQLVGLGVPVVGIAGRALTGGGAGAAVAMGVKAILDNPGVKSHLAIALSRASGASLPVAQARVLGYVNALSQGVAGGSSQPSTD